MFLEQRSDKLPGDKRFEYFHSLVSNAFFPMSCEQNQGLESEFGFEIRQSTMQQMGFTAIKSSPLDVYRRRDHIACVSDSMYMVKIQTSGDGLVRHRGREAHLTPGDFTLCSSEDPYELHFPHEYSQVVLSIPQPLLQECVRNPDQHLGVRMDAQVGANGLFSQFVASVGQRLDAMDSALAQRLEANVLDLLATALGYAQEEQKHDLLSSGVKAEYLNRIRYFIRKHLDDERLKPDWIAAAHDISTRYLHMLFEGEGESISRYIQRLRLEACATALGDAGFADYSVSEIGYRFGFNDASHFSRAFKAHFGESPARYRKSLSQA